MSDPNGMPPAPGGGYLPYGVDEDDPHLTGEQTCEDCGLQFDIDLDHCPRCASEEAPDGGPNWWEHI